MQRGKHRAAGHGQGGVSRLWFTRVRALLAGALVLGVGATLTLAAWTDEEHASAEFTTSVFDIEGSKVKNSGYASHPSGAPATLTFTPEANELAPGSTVYAPYFVRTSEGSTVSGSVLLGGATATGGLAGALRYGVKAIDGEVCDETTYNASTSVVVPDGRVLSVGATESQPLAAAGTSKVGYCFAISLPSGTSNDLQGESATATWTFTATSGS